MITRGPGNLIPFMLSCPVVMNTVPYAFQVAQFCNNEIRRSIGNMHENIKLLSLFINFIIRDYKISFHVLLSYIINIFYVESCLFHFVKNVKRIFCYLEL